jgi:hypothetical protein
MEISEKIELNKKIRKYSGDNSFILSLKRNLKSTKNFFMDGDKKVKILSDRQYEVFKELI